MNASTHLLSSALTALTVRGHEATSAARRVVLVVRVAACTVMQRQCVISYTARMPTYRS